MNKTKVIYWILTVLVCVSMGFGAVMNALSSKESVDLISGYLGFPPFMVPFVGVAKLLGIVAIVIPGFPRLKEWAYAGFIFDLLGAMAAHIAVGAAVSVWAPLFVLIAVVLGSYFYHHKLLKASQTAVREK